ncbi:MAG: hypothetical protein JWO78_268 [Micavibrio sp.]|nr:hypothetical protein [Micavibrio sp.]
MTDQTAQARLYAAAKAGDKATIRALVFEDVDFGARDEEGRTAFNIATQHNKIDAAQTILAAKQTKDLQRMGLISDGFHGGYQGEERRGFGRRSDAA